MTATSVFTGLFKSQVCSKTCHLHFLRCLPFLDCCLFFFFFLLCHDQIQPLKTKEKTESKGSPAGKSFSKYNIIIKSWPQPIKNSCKQRCVRSSQVHSAILFTLQMRLSYTMYSKMGLTASNSSHLPTKASFPESSSPPLLPPLLPPPLPSSALSLTHSPPSKFVNSN